MFNHLKWKPSQSFQVFTLVMRRVDAQKSISKYISINCENINFQWIDPRPDDLSRKTMEWNLIFYFSISMFIRHKQKIVPIEENYFKENKKWREWNFQIQYQDLVIRWEIFFKGSESSSWFFCADWDKDFKTRPNPTLTQKFNPPISAHNLDAWSMHADLLLVSSNVPSGHSLGISRNISPCQMFSGGKFNSISYTN